MELVKLAFGMVMNLLSAFKPKPKKVAPPPAPHVPEVKSPLPVDEVKDPDVVEEPVPEIDAAITITASHLYSLGVNTTNVTKYLPHLNSTAKKYNINTPLKIAHFLAQILHESGSLKFAEELASGEKYEGRKDLGNTQVGDGKLFKGRGLIQVTGRANYASYGNYLGQDVVADPLKLKDPELACDSAGWFWSVFKKDKAGNSLNDMAENDDFLRITYFINGGTNGLEHRFSILKIAYKLFGVTDYAQRIEKFKRYAAENLENTKRTSMQAALFKTIPDLKTLSRF